MSFVSYAAKVEKEFIFAAKHFEKEIDLHYRLMATVGLIRNGTHFSLPDNGRIFDDGLKGIVGRDEHRLPFPVITISTNFTNPDGSRQRQLLIAEEVFDDDEYIGISLIPTICNENGDGKWRPALCYIHIRDALSINDRIAFDYNCFRFEDSSVVDDIEIVSNAWHSVRTLFELIEALSCKNVTSEVLQKVDKNKNARRVRDGKLPIYETRVLVIEAGRESHNKSLNMGSHASPRQHLRRGHIRRLPSGNIWVSACVVGSAEKGVIEKRYAVLP